MRVAYVTSYDAADLDAFNGSAYWVAECMRRQSIEVDLIGPLRKDAHRYAVGIKHRVYERLLHRRYDWQRDPLRVRAFGREIAAKLAERPADAVLSGVSPGSQPVAYLECREPIVIWTDATFAAAARQNRETLRLLARETRRAAYANERAALERAALVIYLSEWAAESARDAYDIPESKVEVLPFGPALEIEHGPDDVGRLIDARPSEPCRLLLVGTKWRGKGADVAVEVTRRLNRSGLRTELDLVGCTPPPGATLPEYVHVHGFLRKSSQADLERLRHLYGAAHFFILPTRAEAFGVAFCEASAYGVPSVAPDVGGVASAVRSGHNGVLFTEGAGPEEYASVILETVADPARYRALARASFAEYQTRLNWTSIGRRLNTLLERVVASSS
jgi:glycosyltransferase involved in cell wall biosynthesis